MRVELGFKEFYAALKKYPSRAGHYWSRIEDFHLEKYLDEGKSTEQIATILKRSPGAISARIQLLINRKEGLYRTGEPWTFSEEVLLRRYDVKEAARLLGRTEHEVYVKLNPIQVEDESIEDL